MQNDTFIKLSRKMLDWRWYGEPYTKTVFIHLLLEACYKPKEIGKIRLDRGEILVTLRKLAKQLGLSVQNIRTAIDRLIDTDSISIRQYGQYNIIRITNYDRYQYTQKTPVDVVSCHTLSYPQKNQHTFSTPNRVDTLDDRGRSHFSSNTVLTHFEEKEKENKEKNQKKIEIEKEKDEEEKNIYNNTLSLSKVCLSVGGVGGRQADGANEKQICGINDNVMLSQREYNDLVNTYGQRVVDNKINHLSQYIIDKQITFRSHYAILNKWLTDDSNKPHASTVKTETAEQPPNSSFDTDEFFEAAINRSHRRDGDSE